MHGVRVSPRSVCSAGFHDSVRAFTLLGALAAGPLSACAASNDPAGQLPGGVEPSPLTGTSLTRWLSQDRMTGDWGGTRRELERKGVKFDANYIFELAANTSGGQRDGRTYTHQIDAGFTFDTDKLFGWKGGTVRITASDRHGRNLSSEYVGNLFEVQELYGGGRITRLAELSVEQTLWDGRLDILIGHIFAGKDFAVSPLYCNFQNNAVCGHPNSIPYNTSISLFPVATWGLRVRGKPRDDIYLQVGAYEANPTKNDQHGFDFGLAGATGTFFMAEAGYLYDQATPGRGLPGNYKIGAYYDTSSKPDNFRDVQGGSRALSGLDARRKRGASGAYVLADQMLYRARPESDVGLTAFGGADFSDRATSYFDYFVEGGLIYQGVLASRPRDKLSFAVAYGHVSPSRADFQRDFNAANPTAPAGVQTHEILFELNYGIQISPWLHVLPNVQYIVRPGATGQIRNATVVGVEFAFKI
jgi:porin